MNSFQSYMRKRFARADRREVTAMIAALLLFVVSAIFAADELISRAAPGAKAAFKPEENTLILGMAALMVISMFIIIYFGTRYR
jgi:hypothetical protein